MESLFEARRKGILKCSFSAVICNRKNAGGLKIARAEGVKTLVFSGGSISDKILNAVKENTDLIVCAGFLSILQGQLLEDFRHRIINIHPALIPSFCGSGMYGLHVHQAALDYGVKKSGCTVHFVESGIDSGPILLQRTVDVLYTDKAEDLQNRIIIEEHIAIVEAVKLISENKITVIGRRVLIEE